MEYTGSTLFTGEFTGIRRYNIAVTTTAAACAPSHITGKQLFLCCPDPVSGADGR